MHPILHDFLAGTSPPLTVAKILAWADDHYARSGEWPSRGSGRIGGAPGETWSGVQHALLHGLRGFLGGDTLSRLLRREGRMGKRLGRPPEAARRGLVVQLHTQGLSTTEIGRRLGISRQAAWQMLKRTSCGACQTVAAG
jgi:hypothetical protein